MRDRIAALCQKQTSVRFGNGPGTLCVIMGRLHITPDVDAISFTPMLPSLGLPALETHSPGEPPAELAGRFETRTAPMVTCGGDADPAGALPG